MPTMTASDINNFKFRGKPFLIIAIGSTLAFIPSIIGLISLIVGETYDRYVYTAPFIIQSFGALIMLIGFIIAFKQLKHYNVKRSGFVVAMVATFIAFVANLLFGIINDADYLPLNIHRMDFGTLLLVISFVSISPLMAIACFKISKYFTRVRGLGVAFTILSVVILGNYYIWFVDPNTVHQQEASTIQNINGRGFYEVIYYSQSGYNEEFYCDYAQFYPEIFSGDSYEYCRRRIVDESLAITTFVALSLALFNTLFLSWRALTMKAKVRIKKKDSGMQTEPMPAMVEAKPREIDYTRYMPDGENLRYMPPVPPVAQAPVRPAASTQETEAVMNELKAMDNSTLQRIVEKASLYNPMVVEKARELLGRREAWEQIKDLSDNELLDMTMSRRGLYAENVVEAASMELYQRDSQALKAQFMSLMPDILSAIANGTVPVPEGIRLAARRYIAGK